MRPNSLAAVFRDMRHNPEHPKRTSASCKARGRGLPRSSLGIMTKEAVWDAEEEGQAEKMRGGSGVPALAKRSSVVGY